MKKIFMMLAALLSLASCKEKKVYPAAQYMAFEQVEFVEESHLSTHSAAASRLICNCRGR